MAAKKKKGRTHQPRASTPKHGDTSVARLEPDPRERNAGGTVAVVVRDADGVMLHSRQIVTDDAAAAAEAFHALQEDHAGEPTLAQIKSGMVFHHTAPADPE